MIRYRTPLFVLVALLATTSPAWSNGRFPKADQVVFDPDDPSRLIVRATFGLLESRDSGLSFDWICEQVIGLEDQEDPMVALTRAGSLVVATLGGLRVGRRDECGLHPIPELDGEIIADLSLDRGNPRRVLALRTRALPVSGFDSQLYVSENDGERFEPLGEPLDPDLLPLSVDIAPSDSDRVYLTARLPREQDYASALLRSEDGGKTFERIPLEGTEDLSVAFIAGVDPDDAERLYLRIADPDVTPLRLSSDGGDSFETIHTAQGALLGFAIAPTGERIAFGGPNDGVWLANADGSAAERRSTLGVSCLGWSEAGLYACSDSTEEFGFGRSDDEGASFESLFAFRELCGNTGCEASSAIGSLCGPAWNALAPRLGSTCNVTAPSSGGATGGAGAGASGAPAQAKSSPGGGCGFAGVRTHCGLGLGLALFTAIALRRRRYLPWLSLLASSCTEPDTIEPYTGPPAYPNRRMPFDPEGRRLAYVSNSLSDSVSVVDLEAFERLSEVPVGRNPVDIDGPHHLAIDREAGLLYVALAYPALSVPSPHAGHGFSEQFGHVQRLALDDLRPLGSSRVDASPGDLVLSPDRRRLLVSHYDLVRAAAETLLSDRRATLVWFEPADQLGTDAAHQSRLTVCIAPHAIAFARDERRAFVACAGEDSIAVVDLVEESLVSMVPVAATIGRPGVPVHEPYAFAADAGSERLLVSNLGSKSAALFSIAELPERLWVTQLLGTPYFAAWLDASRIVVPVQAPSGALILDAETGELSHEVSFSRDDCLNPHEAVVSSDGRLFLVCEGDRVAPGTIVELDADSLEVSARLEVGVYPDRLVLLDP